MGRSSNTPDILSVEPSVPDKISPVDADLLELLEMPEVSPFDAIRNKRYDLLIQCTKKLKRYIEMVKHRDDILQNYATETQASNLTISMSKKLDQKTKEYKEVMEKAITKRDLSWNKVVLEVCTSLTPQIINLQHDIRRLTRACQKFILNHIDPKFPEEDKDFEICKIVQEEILPMLLYTAKGLVVFKELAKDIQQPDYKSRNCIPEGCI